MMRKTALAASALLGAAGCMLGFSAAHATSPRTIFCDTPRGYTFFMHDKAGWQKDGIGEGAVLVTFDSSGKADDIVYVTTNNKFSARGDGAVVRSLFSDGKSSIVMAVYPLGTTDVFHLAEKDGRVELTILTAKPSASSLTGHARSSLFASTSCTIR